MQTHSVKIKTLLVGTSLALGTIGLVGCAAPLFVGAAGAAGYASVQDRGAKQTVVDLGTLTHIKDRLTNTDYRYFSDINVIVYENEVLLTGIVPDRSAGEEVLQVVQETPGVERIYNEILVGSGYTFSQKAQDAWINAQIQPRILGADDVYQVNYHLSVVNGHVYVIGAAQTQAERQHVLHILRTVKGVKQVHDYVRLTDPETQTIGEDGMPEPLSGGKSVLQGVDKERAPSLPADSFQD